MDIEEQYDKLLRYCYMKTMNRELAEDIVQETFTRFFVQDTYRNSGKQLAYLYTIARNLCIDTYRKPSTESIESIHELAAETKYEPENRIDAIVLEKELEKLPEELRESIILRYTNEVSVVEIARIMNLSRFAVHRRLKEGLAILKQNLMEGET